MLILCQCVSVARLLQASGWEEKRVGQTYNMRKATRCLMSVSAEYV